MRSDFSSKNNSDFSLNKCGMNAISVPVPCLYKVNRLCSMSRFSVTIESALVHDVNFRGQTVRLYDGDASIPPLPSPELLGKLTLSIVALPFHHASVPPLSRRSPVQPKNRRNGLLHSAVVVCTTKSLNRANSFTTFQQSLGCT